MNEPERISLREAAVLLMSTLEARGARFVWRDAEHHDFRCELDPIIDWRGLPSPEVLAPMVLDYRDEIRGLLREQLRTH